MEPISVSGAHCVLRQECQEPIFCISALNCAEMRSLSYQISAYRARYICLKSEVARLLSAQITAMEPISGSGDYCVLKQDCLEPIFCISAFELCENALAIVPNICLQSGVVSAYRAGQNLPIERGKILHKQRGSHTVICPNSSEGTYYGIRQPIVCLDGSVINLFSAYSALNCAKMNSLSYQISAYRAGQYMPIEQGRICLKSEAARLLSAQIAEMEPTSGSRAYCVLRQECQDPIFCMSALKCAKMRSLSYQISAYRARQYLPKKRGSQTVICPNSGDGTYFGIRRLLCT